MIRAVLFDLDDTLLDRATTIDGFLPGQHQRYAAPHVPYSVYRQRFHALDRHGYGDKLQLFTTLVAEFALPTTAQVLLADFRQHAWRTCQLFSDARAVLAALRARGYRLGIITNGSSGSQRAKLHATGLQELVDVSLISAEEGVKKPEPIIFERAAQRLGVAHPDCLFVGDNPRTDIGGAAGAGFATVWCRRALPWPDQLATRASYTIGQLQELLALKLS